MSISAMSFSVFVILAPVGIDVVVGELDVVDDESEAAWGGVDGVHGARVGVEPEMEMVIRIHFFTRMRRRRGRRNRNRNRKNTTLSPSPPRQ